MSQYGFVTENLLSTSTSCLQINFSASVTGYIIVSTSPISTGSGSSFTVPSGSTVYEFSGSSVQINVDLSKYYIAVVVSQAVDFTLVLDGNTLSYSSESASGSCGYYFDITMNNGLELQTITCSSFGKPFVGSTSIPLQGACTCSGFSCSGCSSNTSPPSCSSTTSTPPSTTSTVASEAVYFETPSPTSTTVPSIVESEAVYIQSIPMKPIIVSSEAVYIQSIPVKPITVSSEAVYIQPKTIPSQQIVSSEAVYITQVSTITEHVTLPFYEKYFPISQGYYSTVNLSASTSMSFSTPTQIQFGLEYDIESSATFSPYTPPQQQQPIELGIATYFITPFVLYELFKYGKKYVKKIIGKDKKGE